MKLKVINEVFSVCKIKGIGEVNFEKALKALEGKGYEVVR